MDQEITISAQPRMEPEICDFVLGNPVEKYGAYRFDSLAEAQGSALAEELFRVEGVVSVTVIGATVTVAKSNPNPWQEMGKQIGQAIRRAMQSAKPLIAQNMKKRTTQEQELLKKANDVIQNQINPAIAAHGGWIELLDAKDNDLFIRMGGGCQGCAASAATLKQGVERSFQEAIPAIGKIIDTTDHTAGQNPYYS